MSQGLKVPKPRVVQAVKVPEPSGSGSWSGRNVQDLRYHRRSLVRSGIRDAIEVNAIHFNIE